MLKMAVITAAICACIALSSCATLENISNSGAAKAIGSFQLNPVDPNNYWYDGRSYEYNAYEIEIKSKPVKAAIKWNGKYIGKTPMVYAFSGTLDREEYLKIQAVPLEDGFKPQEGVLRIRQELPRKIEFDFNDKPKINGK